MNQIVACPACHSKEIRFSYQGRTRFGVDARRWRLDRCETCTHEFLNPQPTWDELAAYYEQGYEPYDPDHGVEAPDAVPIEQARREGKYRHVAIRPGMKLLDAGCGAGFFLRNAAIMGANVQGVEPSAIAVEAAQRAGAPPIFHGTLEEYADRHPDRKFDLITSNHVLEHVPDPVATMEAMARLLADGGMVWISVPNASCADNRALKSAWHSSELPLHLMHFTPKSLVAAGEKAGLRARSVSTYSLPQGVAASLHMRLRRTLFIPLRLTSRLSAINTRLAPRRARKLDATGGGESIIAEFVAGPADMGPQSSPDQPRN